jgi:hypothetical protein
MTWRKIPRILNNKNYTGKGRAAAILIPQALALITWRALSMLGVLAFACLLAQAQPAARVSSVTGPVALSAGNRTPAFALTTGYELAPGDRVDTHGGGRVTIELSDGSMIVVQPESLIVFKNFRNAASIRELFYIMLGTVRVTINHLGGRPNPYRIDSPTASIAVRGTEFSIIVDNQGDTQVLVYEGVVQVTSLADPAQSILIEAGRGVQLVPGQAFELFNVPSAREIAEQRQPNAPNPQSRNGPMSDRDLDSPRNIASVYEQYIAGLTEIGQAPFLLRYNAFPEAHLDSFENPAYATSFSSAETRVVLLPSLNGSGGLDENATPAGLSMFSPLNYSAAGQVSLFSPLPGGFVIGGNVTGSRIASGVQGQRSDLGLSTILSQMVSESGLQSSGSSAGAFLSGSFLVARRLGSSTSVGVAFEDLQGTGSLTAQTLAAGVGASTIERINSGSTISQNRISFGLEKDLAHDLKLGLFYRYGLIDAGDAQTIHTLNGVPEPLDSTRSSGHASEIGLRLRGPLGRKLFFGVEASWLGLGLSGDLVRAITVNSYQRDRARRASAAVGLGYFINQRTVLSLDLAGGTSLANTGRAESAGGLLLQAGNQNSRFVSANLGMQTNLSRHLFVNASYLYIGQANGLNQLIYPDSLGNTTMISDPFLPLTATGYQPPRNSSDFGVGWRFSNGLVAQYMFSTSYGVDSSSHTLMLLYIFRRSREEHSPVTGFCVKTFC